MRTLLTALLVLALATPAMAAFKGPGTEPAPQVMGGFKGPHSMGVTKASQVAAAHDDTPVNLPGHLVEQLAPYKYTFRDETGSVVVDIDQRARAMAYPRHGPSRLQEVLCHQKPSAC